MRILDGAQLLRCFERANNLLNEKKEEVNVLNVFPVPDGDTGTNMSLTMQSAIKHMQGVKSASAGNIGKALGMGSLMGARGNSGVILSQLCRGFSDAVAGKEVIRLEDFRAIFRTSKDKAYKAVMKPTEGTILTIARAFSEYAEANIDEMNSIEELLEGVLAYGQYTLEQTPEMLPALKEAGVVDAGGQGLIYLLAGFLSELSGRPVQELLEIEHEEGLDSDHALLHEQSSLAYLVEAELLGVANRAKKMESVLAALTSNLTVNPLDDNLKVTFEADELDKSLTQLANFSEIVSLTVKNQTSSTKADKNVVKVGHVEEKKEDVDLKNYGFVAVSLGEGFDEIFKSLMVDRIVSGGQTMNPSTQDLYEAVNQVNAKNVFIFPNNKNIIMAAEQVNELSDKNVIVIPTKSIPQGFTALFNFEDQASPEENKSLMTESLSTIKTGQITYAVRDTEVNSIQIKKDDYIGLIDGEIVQAGQDMDKLLMELLEDSIDEESSLITVYGGSDVDKDAFTKLASRVEKKFVDFDVDFEFGDQPTYYYIFSIE